MPYTCVTWIRSAISIALVILAPSALLAQEIRITLLGTGGPEPQIDRFGPATLVEAGGEFFLFDAGRGVTQRLWQLRTRVGQVKHVFLTHLHSDHVVGLPDVWLSGWMQTRFGQRNSPLRAWGPTGTAAMASALRQAYAADVQSRSDGAALPDSVTAIVGQDIEPGTVYERAGVKILAFAVDHGRPPFRAFGYRLEFAGRSVVISGDTRPSDNVVRFGQGADVLIHEVMAAGPQAAASAANQRILSSHTSPEQAGRIFARAQPKLAVYTHIGLVAAVELRDSILASLIPRTRTEYAGRLELGEDLMTIVVGDSIEVRRAPASHPDRPARVSAAITRR